MGEVLVDYATEEIRQTFNYVTSLGLRAAASDATTTRAELDNLSWQATTLTANLGALIREELW
ncbi:hypothetical protein [Virgisporangium ochraceum]|uniref:hypothetical protein n=1 Tax=Virgisporangium ochraceum TaxID=65505 RepID=UPI0019417E83|nr:hypothetical protein [Virgisporangium ochraceum]